ncbi:MAG: hypothetical protein ABIH00_07860 [Armatimonadota bacterium]
MRKNRIIILLVLFFLISLSLNFVLAQKTKPAKRENPIKNIEVLEYEVDSNVYEYPSIVKRPRVKEILIKGSGVIVLVFLLCAVILGFFSGRKVGKILYIISVIMLGLSLTAHIVISTALKW